MLIVIVDLEATSVELDTRVTVLEENGGGDGNSSVAELEVRVETLEGTVADHETRLTVMEENIEGFSKVVIIKFSSLNFSIKFRRELMAILW